MCMYLISNGDGVAIRTPANINVLPLSIDSMHGLPS